LVLYQPQRRSHIAQQLARIPAQPGRGPDDSGDLVVIDLRRSHAMEAGPAGQARDRDAE
jgi:hypothetical protein